MRRFSKYATNARSHFSEYYGCTGLKTFPSRSALSTRFYNQILATLPSSLPQNTVCFQILLSQQTLTCSDSGYYQRHKRQLPCVCPQRSPARTFLGKALRLEKHDGVVSENNENEAVCTAWFSRILSGARTSPHFIRNSCAQYTSPVQGSLRGPKLPV